MKGHECDQERIAAQRLDIPVHPVMEEILTVEQITYELHERTAKERGNTPCSRTNREEMEYSMVSEQGGNRVSVSAHGQAERVRSFSFLKRMCSSLRLLVSSTNLHASSGWSRSRFLVPFRVRHKIAHASRSNLSQE